MKAPQLVDLALRGLRRMQLPDGLFCYERLRGNPAAHGSSVRYTLMVLIGLHEAGRHGVEHGFDLARIWNAAVRKVDAPELVPGDLGLYLWASALGGRGGEDELAERLDRALPAAGGLPAREGMEPAWIVVGAAHQSLEQHLGSALDVILGNQADSGLLHHSGLGRRRRFPNFATQIYGVLALATVARLGLDDRALPAARRVADRLLELQLPDGGWPWLYDAKTGRVLERYEIYSVHQHGMAPMALLPLAEVSGDERYADAARRGLEWIDGRNELGQDMVDEGEKLVLRSIRRRRPFDRLAIYANTAAASAIGRPVISTGRGVEVYPICRSYELGWLVNAWAGR